MREMARIFKALADETRLQIMALLLHSDELCVCDCMQVLAISQSKASRHLRYLANAGLVEDRREAVWVYYRISPRLDIERSAILEQVRALTAGARSQDLIERLNEWKERKKLNQADCSVV
jgi:ArsR family transcriptional regulator, arsenate/arsenite/antimonite-responsive transcriptional repressor